MQNQNTTAEGVAWSDFDTAVASRAAPLTTKIMPHRRAHIFPEMGPRPTLELCLFVIVGSGEYLFPDGDEGAPGALPRRTF
jgi:hypothetical protein